MNEERLFNRWIELKYNIQFLAGIVQNPIEFVKPEDVWNWLNEYESFINKLQILKDDTLTILPRR